MLFVKKICLFFSLNLLSFNIIFADDKEIADIFSQYKIHGTLIINSLDGETAYIYNQKRAQQPMLPASTFKILNTLIALEEGVIKDENQVIKWDGKNKGWKKWNSDQTLKTAYAVSCVWCYQDFASQIGNEKYLEYFNRVKYANKQTGPNLETFWLDGDLAISTQQQIEFLRQLYHEKMPFSARSFAILKKIMIAEQTPEYTLRAKTGWAARVKDQHGWYIGYIVSQGKVWLFANNIQIKNRDDLKYRQKIVRDALQAKGIISKKSVSNLIN